MSGGRNMKIAQINILPYGSTGRIMLQLAEVSREMGHSVKTFTPVRFLRKSKDNKITISDHSYWGTRLEAAFHYYVGTLLGINGLLSIRGTRQLIAELERFHPDIIHLHNIHMYCINLPMLFRYIKKNSIRVVWTLHDCWSFTGHCPYFTIEKCERWKTECHNCPQPQVYPKMYLDTSRIMYNMKKKWFCGVNDLTIVTPSKWLAGLVKQSFLKNYPVKVINNGIDLNIFKPTTSNFRKKYGIQKGKYIILGVAFGWGERKGLDVFIELAQRLDSHYQIVLVGTDDRIDELLPSNIISIHQTTNQVELAQIYSAADLLLNPTREENYPTVNMESVACGTPVLTFDTGGSGEMLDSTCGRVCHIKDLDFIESEIKSIALQRPFSEEACVHKAQEYSMFDKFKEYVKLYEDCSYSSSRTIY